MPLTVSMPLTIPESQEIKTPLTVMMLRITQMHDSQKIRWLYDPCARHYKIRRPEEYEFILYLFYLWMFDTLKR
jgi:hypothetical protein